MTRLSPIAATQSRACHPERSEGSRFHARSFVAALLRMTHPSSSRRRPGPKLRPLAADTPLGSRDSLALARDDALSPIAATQSRACHPERSEGSRFHARSFVAALLRMTHPSSSRRRPGPKLRPLAADTPLGSRDSLALARDDALSPIAATQSRACHPERSEGSRFHARSFVAALLRMTHPSSSRRRPGPKLRPLAADTPLGSRDSLALARDDALSPIAATQSRACHPERSEGSRFHARSFVAALLRMTHPSSSRRRPGPKLRPLAADTPLGSRDSLALARDDALSPIAATQSRACHPERSEGSRFHARSFFAALLRMTHPSSSRRRPGPKLRPLAADTPLGSRDSLALARDDALSPIAATQSRACHPERSEGSRFHARSFVAALLRMTHPFPIAATLRVLLLDGCVTLSFVRRPADPRCGTPRLATSARAIACEEIARA